MYRVGQSQVLLSLHSVNSWVGWEKDDKNGLTAVLPEASFVVYKPADLIIV